MSRGVATVLASRLAQQFAINVKAGKVVRIPGFGQWELTVAKARKGRNPRLPEVEIVIPESRRAKFRQHKSLKAYLNETTTNAS